MRYLRISAGLAAWIVSGVMLLVWVRGYFFDQREDGRQVATDLWEFASAERRFVQLQLERSWPLGIGDPIYRVDGPDSIQQVGEIRRRVPRNASEPPDLKVGPTYEALIYPNAPPIGHGTSVKYHATPRSMAWVIETMLPPKKRVRIAREIMTTFEAHHAKILDALRPIVVAGLLDAMRVAEDDLAKAVARRRDELEAIGNRYQDRVVEKEIAPLVRQEIWPILRKHAEPLANEIGEELFARASLWRFGWRLLYDKSFFPEKNLSQTEWNRFVDEEGIPVFNSHRSDFVAVQRAIAKDVANNPRIRNAVRHNLTRVVDDQEFRAIVWDIFREVVVDNPRLRDTLEQRWRTVEARRAVQLAAVYVEPCVRRIGDLLIGTRADGISPEFAQVLRNQILDKDCRWLVIETPLNGESSPRLPEGSVLQVRHGGYPKISPFAVQLQGGVQ